MLSGSIGVPCGCDRRPFIVGMGWIMAVVLKYFLLLGVRCIVVMVMQVESYCWNGVGCGCDDGSILIGGIGILCGCDRGGQVLLLEYGGCDRDCDYDCGCDLGLILSGGVG